MHIHLPPYLTTDHPQALLLAQMESGWEGSVIEEVEVAADMQQDAAKAGMPQFNLEYFPTQIFWLALTFLFLLVMMRSRLIPRIEEVLEHRQSKIRQDLERASEMQRDAEQTRLDYETGLQAARQQSSEFFRQTETTIAKLQDERSHKLEQSLKKQMEEAGKRIETAKMDALRSVELKAPEVARALCEKLGFEVDAAAVKAAANRSEAA